METQWCSGKKKFRTQSVRSDMLIVFRVIKETNITDFLEKSAAVKSASFCWPLRQTSSYLLNGSDRRRSLTLFCKYFFSVIHWVVNGLIDINVISIRRLDILDQGKVYNPQIGFQWLQPLRERIYLSVMSMNGYSKLPKATEQEPHH